MSEGATNLTTISDVCDERRRVDDCICCHPPWDHYRIDGQILWFWRVDRQVWVVAPVDHGVELDPETDQALTRAVHHVGELQIDGPYRVRHDQVDVAGHVCKHLVPWKRKS